MANGAELARRFGLMSSAGVRLDKLRDLLASDPQAPTAVRQSQRIVEDHLADSLVALDLPALRSGRSLADVGSGAGLPGLPLAIALPRAAFVLLESSGRKCQFIRRAASVCGLGNVEVVHARVESWAEGAARCDVVLVRAVAPLEVVVEYAAPLLAVGGSLVAWRGRRDRLAEERAARAADLLGLRPDEVRRVRPYAEARDRYLHLFSKVTDTPPKFPRPPGRASKRPLGWK